MKKVLLILAAAGVMLAGAGLAAKAKTAGSGSAAVPYCPPFCPRPGN